MDTDIAFVATGYIVTRIAVIAAFAWVFYRILRNRPARIRVEDQTSRYALERLQASRGDRRIPR